MRPTTRQRKGVFAARQDATLCVTIGAYGRVGEATERASRVASTAVHERGLAACAGQLPYIALRMHSIVDASTAHFGPRVVGKLKYSSAHVAAIGRPSAFDLLASS